MNTGAASPAAQTAEPENPSENERKIEGTPERVSHSRAGSRGKKKLPVRVDDLGVFPCTTGVGGTFIGNGTLLPGRGCGGPGRGGGEGVANGVGAAFFPRPERFLFQFVPEQAQRKTCAVAGGELTPTTQPLSRRERGVGDFAYASCARYERIMTAWRL